MPIDRRLALRAGAGFAAVVTGAVACERGSPTVPPPGQASPTRGASVAPAASGTARPPAALPAEVTHGPRDRSDIALTFHGQGDPALIHSLLGALAAGGVRATVLAVGTWLATNPASAREVLGGGHELGNHTEHHLAIDHLPTAQARAEIESCAQALHSLTGSIGAWFRPSQAQHATARVRALATQVGYPTCLSYDVDSLDYTDPTPDTVVGHTLAAVRPGSIVSMHFGHAVTVSAMPRILAGLRARGLHAVTVTELLRS